LAQVGVIMKAFIDRVFKMKKQKKEMVNNEEITENITEQATEAAITAIKVEKTKHDINECACYKCELARDQGAK
jgi:uncharacterized protein (UPF0305 family)